MNCYRMPVVAVSCIAILAAASCRTGKNFRLVVSEVRCAATPLRNAIAQINATALASNPNVSVPTLALDLSPAEIQWSGVHLLNTNAAARLVAEYNNDHAAWTNATHPINLECRWALLSEVAYILAATSGGYVCSADSEFAIRYAPRKLELREYPHAGWYYVMDEDR